MHALVAPLFVGMDDGFGVTARAVPVTAALQIAADIGVVVDLAVEDDPDRPVFVRRRLLAGAQIDDAEAAVGKGGVCVEVQARLVGPAVDENVAHADRTRLGIAADPIVRYESGNPTHNQIRGASPPRTPHASAPAFAEATAGAYAASPFARRATLACAHVAIAWAARARF